MTRFLATLLLLFIAAGTTAAADTTSDVDYHRDVKPLMNKYCLGCHSGSEPEGDVRLDTKATWTTSFRDDLKPIVPGESEKSLIIKLMRGTEEPAMPPDDPSPTEDEIALIARWIDAGAPIDETDTTPMLTVPEITLRGPAREPIYSSAWHPESQVLALGLQNRGLILEAKTRKTLAVIETEGAVTGLRFSADGTQLFFSSGQPGLFGEVGCYSLNERDELWREQGHDDAINALAIHPESQYVATGSYDRKIQLWDRETGETIATLSGHHGAVNDIAFDATGRYLASASDDSTVKLWDLKTQKRIATLSEPTKEQTAVAFHPSKKIIAAVGKDKRLRVWNFFGGDAENMHPIRHTRFAHDAAILALAFSPDGTKLVTTGEDQSTKIWDGKTYTQMKTLDAESDWVSSLVISTAPHRMLTTRLDGSWQIEPLAVGAAKSEVSEPLELLPTPEKPANIGDQLTQFTESEPNDKLQQMSRVTVPCRISGTINADDRVDVDSFAFEAEDGETLVLETRASRIKSPVDTKLEILTTQGDKIPRLVMRSIRDSYITFRPEDSKDKGMRMHNWQEVGLNDYIYMNGEVVRIFRLPQGPDSDFLFYGINGKRRAYFGTSGLAHALGETIYVVEPYEVDAEFVENGLPVFPIYYENDDEGTQRLDNDSRILFTAPETGQFVARVSDVRSFQGDSYTYELIIRAAAPDFEVSLSPQKIDVPAGSGEKLTVKLNRIDGFEGDVTVTFENVPAGYQIASPITVQAGHVEATTVLNAAADAKPLTEDDLAELKITAQAHINDQKVTHDVDGLKSVKVTEQPKVQLHFLPDGKTSNPAFEAAPFEITIHPGETITAMLRMTRNDFDGGLKQDVLNLPLGIIVDNIGLSGILIRENETERQIFLTAADWVQEQDRLVFAVTKGQGDQASYPVLLKVQKRDEK